MKKNIGTLALTLFAVALLSGSCSKWLEATSSTQVSDTKMFSSRAGFHEALTGIYINLGQPSGYGRDYTWLVNDMVYAGYRHNDGSLYKNLQAYKFSDVSVVSYVEGMWMQAYNVVANVNKVLAELDSQTDVVPNAAEVSLIRGELLAIRAYMMFDLVCLYGVSDWKGDNASKMAPPYPLVYSKEPAAQLSYAETESLLMSDIDSALECLKVDPITGNAPEGFDIECNTDDFWSNRTKHLNYYAVKALKARVDLWRHEYEEARTLAKEVIDEVLDNGVASWLDADAFVKATDNDNRDWTFSTEHLFSLEITDLYGSVASYMITPGVNSFPPVCLDESNVNVNFAGISGQEDVRGAAMMLKYISGAYSIYKFYGSSSQTLDYRNKMPMIRLSELYCIVAATYILEENPIPAIDAINEIRSHRGITDSLSPDAYSVFDADLMWLAFSTEVRKEFIGEGRYGYFLRCVGFPLSGSVLNDTASGLSFVAKGTDFILPYPVSEFTYGRRQEL